MTDDIVTRLRQYIPPKPYNKLPKSVEDMQEAADEIERSQAREKEWKRLAGELAFFGVFESEEAKSALCEFFEATSE